MKAKRYNEGKPKWSLIHFESLLPMVEVSEYGASKYEAFNWMKGHVRTELCESLLRHVFAYMSGEDNDAGSGMSHIGHIQCNAMYLAYNHKHKPELDDRVHGDVKVDKETIVYISGKITGLKKNVYTKMFKDAEKDLKENFGFDHIMNPVEIGKNVTPPKALKTDDEIWSWYLARDLNMISECGVTCLYMLKNWKESKGAVLEHEYAKNKGLEIIYQ